jgi:SNF2 family DNA or RNA helicase
LKELWSLLNFILPVVFCDFQEFNDWFNKPFDSIEEPTSTKRKKNIRQQNLMKLKDSRSEELTEEVRVR